MTVLLLTLAIMRVPSDKRIVVEKPTIQEVAQSDDAQTVNAKKQDRVRVIDLSYASTEPKSVAVERVVPPADAPASMPPVVMTQEDNELTVARRRRRNAEGDDNVCTRHHLHKVYTHGGRSWRCR